jgi:hypothetical protein
MQSGLKVLSLAATLAVVSSATFAAVDDANPTGTWKWSFERNGTTIETTLKLKLDGEKLTGSMTGRDGKETEIEDTSWSKDSGEVKFSISRERNGNKITIKYAGKVSGDTITGTSSTNDRSRDWKAERAK